MNHSRISLTVVLVLAGVVGMAGCGEDPQQRITLLEQENQQLLDELGTLRAEANTAGRDRDLCEQELARLRTDNASLMARVTDLESTKQEVPEGWTAVPGGAMIALPSEVLFQSGKAALRPEAKRSLDQVAQVINSEYATQDVLVYGHTDDVPIKKSGWKDNLELSAQRAMSVVRYMQSRGVAPTRMVAGGCGEYRPTVPNTSAASRTRNRRVEVYALDATVRPTGR